MWTVIAGLSARCSFSPRKHAAARGGTSQFVAAVHHVSTYCYSICPSLTAAVACQGVSLHPNTLIKHAGTIELEMLHQAPAQTILQRQKICSIVCRHSRLLSLWSAPLMKAHPLMPTSPQIEDVPHMPIRLFQHARIQQVCARARPCIWQRLSVTYLLTVIT